MKKRLIICQLLVLMLGCSRSSEDSEFVRIDGSSTVYPLTEAVTEDFRSQSAGVKVTVGISGTGGGFKKFCAKETDITNASRPIKQTEIEACEKTGITFYELPVAYDALTVVVNPENTWAETMTVPELATIWKPESQAKITNWSQVRSGWPDIPLRLFGPGVDSGTFDYFTEAIVGKEDAARGDYTSSEDDNVVVQGVSSDKGALGFFGLSYYEANKQKVKAIGIDDGKIENGEGGQVPSTETVRKGSYQPLSRPLFVHVSEEGLNKSIVAKYIEYYLGNVSRLATEVGYVPLSEEALLLTRAIISTKRSGSIFSGKGSLGGITIEEFLKSHAGK